MNISQLPYIIAIASAGNLSAASRQLEVSQPALSKYLRELEGEVGLELFFRSKKQYILTPAGRTYVQAARRILELQRHTKSSVAALDSANVERLRIGLSPNWGINTMAKVYPMFDKRYPQVELSLRDHHALQIQQLLLQDQIDAAITVYVEDLPQGIEASAWFRSELVLAVPSFHPLVRHDAFTFDELPFIDLHAFQDAVFIMPSQTSSLYALIQSLFSVSRFHPQVTTTTPNIVMQEAMIRSGARVGLLPAYSVRPNPDIAFFRVKNSPSMILGYLTRSGHRPSEAERYLIYLILKQELQMSYHTALWSPSFQQIMWEFDPVEAANQNLEGVDEN